MERDTAPSVVDSTLPVPNPPTAENELSTETPSVKTDGEAEYLGPRALTLLMSSLMLAVLVLTLDQAILATAIPKITDQFHTIADIGWYASAYMICNASLQPLTGKFYTYFSLRYTFFGFIAVFELGSLICGVAHSSTMLVVGRAVAGMGGSGIQNGALTMIATAAPPSRRPMLMGIVMALAASGQLIAPLIGGALTQHVSWRWCFYINLPVGGATILVMSFIQLPTYKNRKTSGTFRDVIHDFDITGFSLFAPACVMLLLALEWGGTTYAWSSAKIIGLFSGSGVTFILFFAWEYQQKDAAMIPLSMIRRRVIFSSMGTQFFQFGALIIVAYYLPLWFQVIKGASPTMSAVYSLPNFASQIIMAILTGMVVTRLGYLAPCAMLGTACVSLSTGLMSTFKSHTGVGKWIGYQIINGCGRGLAIQQPIQAVQAAVQPAMVPVATALVSWAGTFGGAIFIGLAETAFLNILKGALQTNAPGVNAEALVADGATSFLAELAARGETALRHEVLISYNDAVAKTFYLGLGCALAAFICATGIGKTKVKKKQKPANKDDVEMQENGKHAGIERNRDEDDLSRPNEEDTHSSNMDTETVRGDTEPQSGSSEKHD